jgi:hypothetical protein
VIRVQQNGLDLYLLVIVSIVLVEWSAVNTIQKYNILLPGDQ